MIYPPTYRPAQRTRPFLKWAGSKFQIIERIQAALGDAKDYKRLIEPFAGSGAVFLNTCFDEYLLADVNADLILLYQTLQDQGEAFINYAEGFFTPQNNRPERYYELRAQFNRTAEPWEKAALFIYLNRHGFNGLCRYNAARREFNVPFGRYKSPYFPWAEMQAFYEKTQHGVQFQHAGFEAVMECAIPGDIVYCDPPYVGLSATANFTSYSASGFTPADQEKLAQLAMELAQRGVPVIISNHNTPVTQALYQAAQVDVFDVQRFISCKGDKREKASEVLAVFGAPWG